jgi:hypothetical protein
VIAKPSLFSDPQQCFALAVSTDSEAAPLQVRLPTVTERLACELDFSQLDKRLVAYVAHLSGVSPTVIEALSIGEFTAVLSWLCSKMCFRCEDLRFAVVLISQHTGWGLAEIGAMNESELVQWIDTIKTILAQQPSGS